MCCVCVVSLVLSFIGGENNLGTILVRSSAGEKGFWYDCRRSWEQSLRRSESPVGPGCPLPSVRRFCLKRQKKRNSNTPSPRVGGFTHISMLLQGVVGRCGGQAQWWGVRVRRPEKEARASGRLVSIIHNKYLDSKRCTGRHGRMDEMTRSLNLPWCLSGSSLPKHIVCLHGGRSPQLGQESAAQAFVLLYSFQCPILYFAFANHSSNNQTGNKYVQLFVCVRRGTRGTRSARRKH